MFLEWLIIYELLSFLQHSIYVSKRGELANHAHLLENYVVESYFLIFHLLIRVHHYFTIGILIVSESSA